MRKQILLLLLFIMTMASYAQINNPAPFSRGLKTPYFIVIPKTTTQLNALGLGLTDRVIANDSDLDLWVQWDGDSWEELGAIHDLSPYQLKPIEGAFVDGDKTKLNSAVQPSDLGATAFSNDYGDLDNLPVLTGYLQNIVEDTTPQLGGQLDVNGNHILLGTNEIRGTSALFNLEFGSTYSSLSGGGSELRLYNGSTFASILAGNGLFVQKQIAVGTGSGITNPGKILADNLTAEQFYQLPDTSGTFALTSDLPSAVTLQEAVDNGNTYSIDLGNSTVDFLTGTTNNRTFNVLSGSGGSDFSSLNLTNTQSSIRNESSTSIGGFQVLNGIPTIGRTAPGVGSTTVGFETPIGSVSINFPAPTSGSYIVATTADVAAAGNVTKVGTPLDNQIGVWTGDGTIEGIAGFTYDSTTATLDIGQTVGELAKIQSLGNTLFGYYEGPDELTVEPSIFKVSETTSVDFASSLGVTVPNGVGVTDAVNKGQLDAVVIASGADVAPTTYTTVGGETTWAIGQAIPSQHKLIINRQVAIEGEDYSISGTTINYLTTITAGEVHKFYFDIAVPTTYDASETTVDASGFSGNLSGTDTDVQTALTTIDGLSLGGGSSSTITNITEYSTAASLPAVTGNETDTYAMVLFDSDANNGLYAIVTDVWQLVTHEDDINWSAVSRASINEINLRGSIVTSTTDATEDGVIVGYQFNLDTQGVAVSSTSYITDFIPIKPKGAVVIGSSTSRYWLFNKDKQPLDDADVDYNLRNYGYTTLTGDDEVAYIRWSLPISSIGNSYMAAQLYNVYENNPGTQVTTGWEDYHGKAMGKVQISAGASGSIDGITANGVQIMSGAESYLTSRIVTATNVAANINAYTSSPNYSATAIGEYVLIWTTATDGSSANGYTIVSSATTLTTVDTNMSGGIVDNYKRDNTRYVFEDNGVIWKRPTNNLFDYRFGEYPRSYQNTGVVLNTNGSTGFIPCKGGFPYTVNVVGNSAISFWTADKTFISGTSDWDGFVTPSTARFFTYHLARTVNFKSINATQSTYTQTTYYNDTGEDVIKENYASNKTFCLIGDSIGTEGATYASLSSYASMMTNTLGITDFINVSVNGKSLNNFANDIDTGRQPMPVADVYIIALGTNDHAFNRSLGTISDTSATDTYYGDMQELQEKLLVLNPDAKFIFITNARRGTSADTTEWNTTTSLWLEQFADATVAFALKNNHGYLDLYKYSNANPQRSVINTNYYVGADATHLNNNGHSLFYYPLVTTLIKKYLR